MNFFHYKLLLDDFHVRLLCNILAHPTLDEDGTTLWMISLFLNNILTIILLNDILWEPFNDEV